MMQDLIQLYALQQRHLWRRTNQLDDAMDDRSEQRRLIVKAVVEGLL
jgi:hypothetical protein